MQVVQVNRTGSGLKSMGGLNSMMGGEVPDIIAERRCATDAHAARAPGLHTAARRQRRGAGSSPRTPALLPIRNLNISRHMPRA